MQIDLIHRLQWIVDATTENSVHRTLADYLLHHLGRLDQLSIQEMADACYASIATVSRFVRSLGFDSFAQLKKQVRYQQMDTAQTAKVGLLPEQLAALDQDGQAVFQYASGIADALCRYSRTVSIAQLDQLAHRLLQSRHVALFGFYQPGLLARHLQFLLLSVGRYTEYYDLVEDHLQRAATLGPGDLALVFSVGGNYLASAAEVINRMQKGGAWTVLVTQNPDPALGDLFHQVILLGDNDGSQAGLYKLQLFTELLFSRYLACQDAGPSITG